MICKCPKCKEYCSGTSNALSSAGINTVNKVADGIDNLRKQITSSTPLIRGVGKALLDSASSILEWDNYIKFECANCGNKWTIKETEAIDETSDYFECRAAQFDEKKEGRILTLDPDANCIFPKDASITLLRTVPSGIRLPDKKFQKGEIYISHPADNTVFFPSTSYRYDVMKDELDDMIVYLQKLGAKSIRIKGHEQTETKSDLKSFLTTTIGIQGAESGGSLSNSSASSDNKFSRLSRKYSKEIKSELLHMPMVDNALLAKWGPIRKEWNAIREMREHGIIEYDFELSCASISSDCNSQVDRIEAEYRELCVITSASVNREIIKSLREETVLGFTIHVEFYPESEYKKFKSPQDNNKSFVKKLFKR